MVQQLKPIETVYDGHRFRSRLEARWSCFFKTLGIRYQYEPEGFDLDGVWYLPDFWLPDHEYWIEIKGQKPTQAETEKAQLLSKLSGYRVFVFAGQLPYPYPDYGEHDGAHMFDGEGGDWPYWWCECLECHRFELQFDGRSDRMKCKQCYGCWAGTTEEGHCAGRCKRGLTNRGGYNGDKGYTFDSSRLEMAYLAARQERFGT